MSETKYGFATYYRVLGTIFIILCHFTEQSTRALLKMSAQFFNIGVHMFIILSGFLFGVQGGDYGQASGVLQKANEADICAI